MSKKTTAEVFVENLNHLMLITELTAEEVGKKSGLTKRAVQYYMNGERIPNVCRAEQLASAFGLEGWHMIMRNLPIDIISSKKLQSLVNNYSNSSDEGKNMINMVAEREAKYTA